MVTLHVPHCNHHLAQSLKPCICLLADISALSLYVYSKQSNTPAEEKLERHELKITNSY